MKTDQTTRRSFLAGLACASTSMHLHAAPEPPLTLAINEAATASVSIAELVRRYEPLAKVLGQATGRIVRPLPFIDVRMFLGELERSPAFILAKTVDILAEQVSTNRYLPLAKVNKPYVAGIITAEGFKGKELTDLIGTDVLLPPPETMTSKLAIAAFHDAGIEVAVLHADASFPTSIRGKVTVRHVQFQEVIPDTIQRGFWYKAGAVNPTMLGKWKGPVLQKFKPQPNWSVAALSDTPPAHVKGAIAGLLGMHTTPEGATALEKMRIERFIAAERLEYIELANYVK